MSLTYGIDIKSVDDPFLKASIEASRAITAVMAPGKFLVDVIPIRACICAQTVTCEDLMDPPKVRYIPDWFPGTEFKALSKEARSKFDASVDGPLEYVKNAMKVRPQSDLRPDRVLNLSVATSPAREFPSP